MGGLPNNGAIDDHPSAWKGPIEEMPEDAWDRIVEVNLKGVFLCCKAVIPVMKQQRSGKIINIASGTFLSGSGDMPSYTASKGGVVGLTRVMAKQLGSFGINVNVMTPGSTMSEDDEEIDDAVRQRRSSSA